ncbi:hypothetical protein GKODMF_09800 [Candidatus Electrothrix gigas]
MNRKVCRTGLFFLFTVGLISSFLSSSSQAAEQRTEDEYQKVYSLAPVTVIATQPGVEITTDKTVIKMDEIKKPGDIRSLTDVLTEIGGVDVQRITPLISSPGDEVSIRGLNEGRMVIEIDGRRINHTGHMGRYIVDWSTLNMDDVDKIEIIRGGHSVLHPFAIGGVINIITKKGKKTDTLKPDVQLKAGYGDFETKNISASVEGVPEIFCLIISRRQNRKQTVISGIIFRKQTLLTVTSPFSCPIRPRSVSGQNIPTYCTGSRLSTIPFVMIMILIILRSPRVLIS